MRSDRCKECGRKLGKRKGQVVIYDRDKIRAMRAEGHTLKEVAERFGCAPSTVQYIVMGKQDVND